MATCLYVVVCGCSIADKVTEGVACYDRTDADAETGEGTDNGNTVSTATPSSRPKTHEKADMAVVTATYPGEHIQGAPIKKQSFGNKKA